MFMLTIDEIRRQNLSALAKRHGSKKALAEILEVSESQLSQWINGSKHSTTGKPRAMRLATCHRIEELTHMPRGWLDTPHTAEQLAEYRVTPEATPPTLEQALEIIGIAIAAVPESRRQELADDMRQWALYGGRERHKDAVWESLSLRHVADEESKPTGT